MRTRSPNSLFCGILLVAVMLAVLAPGNAAAAAPGNDDIANATQVQSLPFSDTVDTTEAGQQDNEGGCGPPTHTVWYVINLPHDATLTLHIRATGFNNPSATLWVGGHPPNANPVCGGPEGDLTYRVQAGQTYYLQIGTRFFWEPGGIVEVSIDEIPAPANDGFAAATTFSDLPFSDSGNMAGATVEPNEPKASPYYPPVASVWYRFTPAASATVSVGGSGIAVAAFSGSHFGDLTQLGFQELAYGVPLTVRTIAGTPIYLQVVPQFGGGGGPFSLTVDIAPPPLASFWTAPFDPSIFDAIQFVDQSYDPVGIGVQSWSWTFGDGATATGCCPTHRYTADGDYSVKLTIATQDGRRASVTQGVHVQTHDVAIRELTVPMNGKVGRTALITVGINNTRYPEIVEVQLLKSVPGSTFQQVGVLTITVPARKGKQTTQVAFSYTFTSDDAAVGKLSFESVATPIGVRDAVVADNTMISPSIRVAR
jgi:PKD repeat protein